MERGQGPHDMFKSGLPGAVSTGQAAFEKCYGSDRTKWPFNTQCCAYNRQSTTCKSPSPGPSPPTPGPSPPAPSTCGAAVEAQCGQYIGKQLYNCMECCRENHATLIKSCPNGIPDMKAACRGGSQQDVVV